MTRKDHTGKKFNRWTVLILKGVDKWGNALWLCECSCDEKTQMEHLLIGSTTMGIMNLEIADGLPNLNKSIILD